MLNTEHLAPLQKKVTLDIDTTEIVAHKAEAQWTYKYTVINCSCQSMGKTPYIKESQGLPLFYGPNPWTAYFFALIFTFKALCQWSGILRKPDRLWWSIFAIPPAQDNLAFIKQCQQSLPEGCILNVLRIDAAGYQIKVIEYCDEHGIDKKGKAISGQSTYRTSFCIGNYEKAFTLVIQRKALKGQASLNLDSQDNSKGISLGGYIYRAIATNRDGLSDNQIVH